MPEDQHEQYMQMALRLARRGIGSIEPNPAVGCVLVKQARIIGKGWHKRFGGPHAEINALNDCTAAGLNPAGATIYVTLEPCSHQGKTGPCTEAIIKAGLGKVVVAMLDPSAHANGRGLEQLRQAGLKVQLGVCEQQARLLNAPFVKSVTTGKCWVILKWAQTIDGKLATAAGPERWISSERSRKDAHKLRRRADAILVGIGTVLADDPLLTARPSSGKKLTRVVLDSNLTIPLQSQLIRTAKKHPVLVVANGQSLASNVDKKNKILEHNADVLACPDSGDSSNLYFVVDELSRRGISRLLVEGGPTVIGSFLKENLADELVVYIAPSMLGPTGSADIASALTALGEDVRLYFSDVKRIGDDVRINGLTKSGVKAARILEGDP